MMKLPICNYNRKTIIFVAALTLASLCSHVPTGCSAWSTAGSQGAAPTLPPYVRTDEAKLLGYGAAVQGRETAGSSGASPSASTFPATMATPSSTPAGDVGVAKHQQLASQRSGDDGPTAPAFESSAVDLNAARRLLLGVGETKSSSKPSCTSNHVPCPPPHRV
jgi:hypothetical protein